MYDINNNYMLIHRHRSIHNTLCARIVINVRKKIPDATRPVDGIAFETEPWFLIQTEISICLVRQQIGRIGDQRPSFKKQHISIEYIKSLIKVYTFHIDIRLYVDRGNKVSPCLPDDDWGIRTNLKTTRFPDFHIIFVNQLETPRIPEAQRFRHKSDR